MLVAAIVAVLNAILPPVIAALRLPFTVAIGFLLVLALDAAMLLVGRRRSRPSSSTSSDFWDALAVAIVASAVSTAIGGGRWASTTTTATRCGSPAAWRGGPASRSPSDAPGILFLEIDGLALPVLRRAIRDGTTPNMARWLADGTPPR